MGFNSGFKGLKGGWALCVWLEGESQEGLSVRGAVRREKADLQ